MRASGNPSSVYSFKVSIAGLSGSSGVFKSVLNPFGRDVLILPTTALNITTQSAVASTLDIGVAADATTANDTVFDAVAGTATGTKVGTKNGGSNGGVAVKWGANQYLNVKEDSGNVDALVADLYVQFIYL